MTNKKAMGMALEEKVEKWAKNRFKASQTAIRYLTTGLSVKRPYEVDVWVRIPRGLFRSDIDLWIECKDRNSSIKRRDISDLISKAKDVYEAADAGKHEFWFDTLMLVSTSRYDSDAIALADQEGVACIFYDGKTYMLKNNWDWDNKPKWLRDIEAAI